MYIINSSNCKNERFEFSRGKFYKQISNATKDSKSQACDRNENQNFLIFEKKIMILIEQRELN